MSFDPNAGSEITLSEGAALTAEYRNNNSSGILALYYNKNLINKILSQSGVVGIRFYFGIDANNNNSQELVLVGVDQNGDDVTTLVGDRGAPCPNLCGTANALNS